MNIYTYSEARQKLAAVLEQAQRDGEVRIKRRDGQVFVVKPVPDNTSPLDVEPVDLDVTTEEIVNFIREGRRTGQEPE